MYGDKIIIDNLFLVLWFWVEMGLPADRAYPLRCRMRGAHVSARTKGEQGGMVRARLDCGKGPWLKPENDEHLNVYSVTLTILAFVEASGDRD